MRPTPCNTFPMNPITEWGDTRLPEDYWENVYPCPVTGCWLWGGPTTKAGYGTYRFNGRKTTAHRALLLATDSVGPHEVGMHSCDFPPCTNPDHVSAGTNSQNLQDCVSRGRHVVWNKSDDPTVCPKDGDRRTPNRNSNREFPQWHCPTCSKRRANSRTPEQIVRDRMLNTVRKQRTRSRVTS